MSGHTLPKIPTPEETVSILKESVAQFHEMQDHLVKTVTPETACFDNVVRPWAQVSNEANTRNGMVWLLQYAAPDQETLDAVREGSKIFLDAKAKWTARRDLFLLFQAVANKNEPLDDESKHLVQIELQDFVSTGHGSLSPTALEAYTKNKQRLEELNKEYMNHLQSNDGIWLKVDDLDGVPEDERQKWKRGESEHDGEVFIPFTLGDITAVLTHADKEDVRKRVSIANQSRLSANVPLFRETVLLRDTQARLLGYSNHAEFRIKARAIQSVDYVNNFLASLQKSLVPRGLQELQRMKDGKLRDRKRRNIYQTGDDNILAPWDVKYYRNKVLQDLGVDGTAVSPYFPLENTIIAMLKLFEDFLGLKFSRIPSDGLVGLNLWHETVEVWETWDAANNRFIGFLYLDLLDRKRKYKGSQNVNIYCGYDRPDGTRQTPATVLMTAFPAPTDGSCIQMEHSQVVTLFHELGHGIHDLVSHTKYSRFHGTRLPVDIGEMPSTLLENLCWDKNILKELSCHYSYLPKYAESWSAQNQGKDKPPEVIPDELLDNLIQNRNIFRGQYHLYQLSISLFDLKIHSPSTHEELEALDFAKLWHDLREQIEHEDLSKYRKDCHAYATFGHLINGYDVGYHGYLCCAAFAQDAYVSQFKPNPRNKTTWKRFHDKILRYGGSHPNQLQMLEGFLGREPNFQALVEGLSL